MTNVRGRGKNHFLLSNSRSPIFFSPSVFHVSLKSHRRIRHPVSLYFMNKILCVCVCVYKVLTDTVRIFFT